MSYTKSGATFVMACNGKPRCNAKITNTLPKGTDDLDGYRSLWKLAKGWTSTSTEHLCPAHS